MNKQIFLVGIKASNLKGITTIVARIWELVFKNGLSLVFVNFSIKEFLIFSGEITYIFTHKRSWKWVFSITVFPYEIQADKFKSGLN